MSESSFGGLANSCAKLSIFARSLEDYVNEIASSNQGTDGRDVPKQVNDAIQLSIQAGIQYHDYMSDFHRHNGHASYDAYHRVMADTYRAMKTI